MTEKYSRQVDHCIESIRQSLTCNADVTALNYRWLPNTKFMQPQLDSPHTCRNFDKIRDWAFDKYVDYKNNRLHVENGKITDYASSSPDPFEHLIIPEDFHHTKEEIIS